MVCCFRIACIRHRKPVTAMLPATVDRNGVELMSRLLQFNPLKRATIYEALNHTYVRRWVLLTALASSTEILRVRKSWWICDKSSVNITHAIETKVIVPQSSAFTYFNNFSWCSPRSLPPGASKRHYLNIDFPPKMRMILISLSVIYQVGFNQSTLLSSSKMPLQ